jgi:hypothetical protein
MVCLDPNVARLFDLVFRERVSAVETERKITFSILQLLSGKFWAHRANEFFTVLGRAAPTSSSASAAKTAATPTA